jgi:hypothetical protein
VPGDERDDGGGDREGRELAEESEHHDPCIDHETPVTEAVAGVSCCCRRTTTV